MQHSNEELASMIQAGERERLPQLWEQVQAFVRSEAARWVRAWKQWRPSIEFDDLYQCGYIALCEAVKTYRPAEGMAFIGWLAFYIKTEFAKEIGCRTKRQRQEPICYAASLDAPLGGEIENMTLGDVIADPENNFEDVEQSMYKKQIQGVVREAVGELAPGQRKVIELRYFGNLTMEKVGEQLNITKETVRQQENRGLRNLRHCRHVGALCEAWYGDRNLYRGTGVNAWKQTGCSVQELELIWQEEKGRL